ncbi:hypothetical protein vBRpoSV10_10 [Ruegeria phage vB_RpoS-V10]|nr:hypothetical protein DSS3P8_011 [Roseobacter phage DSS3P8]AWY09132.1 hypothetical protein vBRpoSV10_10 [Ruegeria phage vB_RpoS-V10]
MQNVYSVANATPYLIPEMPSEHTGSTPAI